MAGNAFQPGNAHILRRNGIRCVFCVSPERNFVQIIGAGGSNICTVAAPGDTAHIVSAGNRERSVHGAAQNVRGIHTCKGKQRSSCTGVAAQQLNYQINNAAQQVVFCITLTEIGCPAEGCNACKTACIVAGSAYRERICGSNIAVDCRYIG